MYPEQTPYDDQIEERTDIASEDFERVDPGPSQTMMMYSPFIAIAIAAVEVIIVNQSAKYHQLKIDWSEGAVLFTIAFTSILTSLALSKKIKPYRTAVGAGLSKVCLCLMALFPLIVLSCVHGSSYELNVVVYCSIPFGFLSTIALYRVGTKNTFTACLVGFYSIPIMILIGRALFVLLGLKKL